MYKTLTSVPSRRHGGGAVTEKYREKTVEKGKGEA